MDDVMDGTDLIALTADVVSAFVANNSVRNGELPRLISETHAALARLGRAGDSGSPAEETFKPAVTVRKSLGSRDHILSMIDGKPYKSLKRHLSRHGLTPAEYRARYHLPKDYPMVAPAYSEARRALALKLHLGGKLQGPRKRPPPAEPRTSPRPGRARGRAKAAG